MNIPLINNVLKRQNENRPSNTTLINDNIIKMNSQFIRDNRKLIEKFNDISIELIKMGFSPNLINNLFLIKRFQTLEEALELLSIKNGLWNHEYIEGDGFICFICGAQENLHIKPKVIKPQHIDPKILKKIHNSERISIEIKEKIQEDSIVNFKSKECPICFSEIIDINIFILGCYHTFCKDCIINYIEEEINNARVDIKCPWKDCSEKFTDTKIKTLVNEKLFNKLKKFRERKQNGNDKNLISCPILDCEGYAKKQPQDLERNSFISGRRSINQIKYTCTNKHNFCGKCNKVWHGKESCEDDREIIDFATTSGKMLKKCIKCKVWTEKNEGCNHMHCKICETDWCWLCEEMCNPDHYRIPNTPCYGRQFNEFDPDFEYYELLIDQNNLLNTIFFFFIFSFLVINGSIRNVLNPNQVREDEMQRPSKFVVFIILICILTFGIIFLILTNGILAVYMFQNLGRLQTVRNNFSKFICVGTFFFILLIFYPFGIVLGCFWFIVCLFYSIVKLIRF